MDKGPPHGGIRERVLVHSPSKSTSKVDEVPPHGPIRLRGEAPSQHLASKAPLSIHFTRNRHNWDTIIVCHLLKDLFGRSISTKEVTSVIQARDGLADNLSGWGTSNIEECIWPEDVDNMLTSAKSPVIQRLYPITCQYQKWEEVTKRLWTRRGKKDVHDKDEMSAWIIYNETLTTANLLIRPYDTSLLSSVRVAIGAIENGEREGDCD